MGNHLLSHAAFNILLALSCGPNHGYGLLLQIEKDTYLKVTLSPATLYTTLKRLENWCFIEEMSSHLDKDHRKHYRITKAGFKRLQSNVSYYQNIANLAQERRRMHWTGIA